MFISNYSHVKTTEPIHPVDTMRDYRGNRDRHEMRVCTARGWWWRRRSFNNSKFPETRELCRIHINLGITNTFQRREALPISEYGFFLSKSLNLSWPNQSRERDTMIDENDDPLKHRYWPTISSTRSNNVSICVNRSSHINLSSVFVISTGSMVLSGNDEIKDHDFTMPEIRLNGANVNMLHTCLYVNHSESNVLYIRYFGGGTCRLYTSLHCVFILWTIKNLFIEEFSDAMPLVNRNIRNIIVIVYIVILLNVKRKIN